MFTRACSTTRPNEPRSRCWDYKFLFCAEERELLLLGDDLYDKNYAVSTLREQLRATADQFGEEILGLRYDAWTRLLTTFRVVYAGAKHDRLKLPAYGGG